MKEINTKRKCSECDLHWIKAIYSDAKDIKDKKQRELAIEYDEFPLRFPKNKKELKEATLHYSDDASEWSDWDIYENESCKGCNKIIAELMQEQTKP